MAMRDESRKVRGEERDSGRAPNLPTFLRSYLLFFVLCFAYLWLVVEPHLIYHCFGTILPDAPLFATGWPFLKDALGTPGGPVTYASGLLSLGYHWAWLGAAIIVLAGLCLSELSRRHLVAAGSTHASVLASLSAIAFFLIYSRYRHPLTVCLTVSLGLLLSLILERLPLRRPWICVVVCCLLAAVGFWFGAGGTLLVFALMTAIHRTLAHRDWTTVALALPASVATIWVLAEYVFLLPARQALLILTPFAPSAMAGIDTLLKVLTFVLYGFVPLAVLLVLVGKKGAFYFFARRPVSRGSERGRSRMSPLPSVHPKKSGAKEEHATAQRKRLSLAIFTKPALAALPVVLMALGLYLSHDGLRKPYVLSNYYWHQKRWDKIVELSHRLPKNRNNVYVNHDTIRSLYHAGRLPYDMFRCPLIPEAILLTHEKGQSDLTQLKLCDIFLELGYVNMAEKLASEVLTTKGYLGMALEELGWISIIKGQPGAARVYLNALKKDPICRRRAESLLRGLDSGFGPDQAASIDRIRSCMLDEPTGITASEPVDETLATLLRHNPRNKMAFEYLMACYLLTGRVDKIAENVDRLPDLGYPTIPTLYEEAILIHYGSTGQQVDLAKLGISPETLQRYEAFVRTMSAMQTQDRQAVLNHLIRDFGTTYFFYYTFGRVGLA
jgi:hypothetical protein